MIGGLTRQLRLQYAMRSEVFWLGGCAFFYMNADHLIFKRIEMMLRNQGILHSKKMDWQWAQGNP